MANDVRRKLEAESHTRGSRHQDKRGILTTLAAPAHSLTRRHEVDELVLHCVTYLAPLASSYVYVTRKHPAIVRCLFVCLFVEKYTTSSVAFFLPPWC